MLLVLFKATKWIIVFLAGLFLLSTSALFILSFEGLLRDPNSFAREIGKALLQVIGVAVLGTTATLLLAQFNRAQDRLQKDLETQRAEQQKEAEKLRVDDQRKLQEELAAQRERQQSLEAYLAQATNLLLNTFPKNADSRKKLGRLMTAHTIVVLGKLSGDGEKKGSVLNFLYQSYLIEKVDPILSLWGLDFKDAKLPAGVILVGANLSGAQLNNSSLIEANLQDAVLIAADLEGANLSGAWLMKAKLYGKPSGDEHLHQAFRFLEQIIAEEVPSISLDKAVLKGTQYDEGTVWPPEFNAEKAGAVRFGPL